MEAETAEHAVVAVAVARSSESSEVIYEAWPEDEPGCNLRMILARRERQLPPRTRALS